MKKSITEVLEKKWVTEATRIRFREEDNFDEIKNKLIAEYRKRHEGNIPQ